MAYSIHARQTDRGLLFRAWDKLSSGYLTEEMSEAQFRVWMLEDACSQAIRKHLASVDHCVQNAIEKGSSAPNDRRDLNSPWNKEWADNAMALCDDDRAVVCEEPT